MPKSPLLWLVLIGCNGTEPIDSGTDTDSGIDSGDTDTDTDTDSPTTYETLDTTRDLVVTSCGTTIPAPPSGELCSVSGNPSSATHILIQGDILLPDSVLDDGAVLVSRGSGEITCSGCDCAEQAPADTLTISCPDGAVSPGLINAHDHIRYAKESPASWGTERYDHRHDWRNGKNEHTKLSSSSSNDRSALIYGELRMLLSGTTSIAGSISSVDASGLLRNLDSSDYNEGLGRFEANYETFPLGDQSGTQSDSGCGAYDIDSPSALNSRVYLPHIAEGINAFANNEIDCLSSSSGGGTDLITNKTSIIHGIGVDADDIADIRESGARLVWSPRSNISLYGDTAPVVTYRNLGVPIALGTDWTPSGSAQMLRELACASDFNEKHLGGELTDREIWLMATQGGAQALGTYGMLGELLPGRIADIAIFDATVNQNYRAVLNADISDVALVMRGGWPLSGDADLIDAVLPSDEAGRCDALTDCLSGHKVCLEDDTGFSLSELKSAVGGNAYGLLQCGVPTEEPTCEPSRNNESNDGVIYPVSAVNDFDGDGLLDNEDNCPTVFNPGRPMDNWAQADVDGDGEGDACDACPTQADASCSWLDLDGDGADDLDDNCPEDANPDQLDADADGLGAACDPCDDFASPEGACLDTVYNVKDGTTAFGTAVALEHLVVTAANEDGFFAQLGSDQPGYSGVDYSGVWVYNRGGTQPNRGDRVTVQGVVKEWFGQTQIDPVFRASLEASGQASPEPVAVTIDEVKDGGTRREALEGTLITVSDVTVSAVGLEPGGGDKAPTNEFELTGGLVVDDFFQLITPEPVVGESFTSLTGVLRWANDKSKLETRDEDDVVAGPASLSDLSPASGALNVGDTLDLTLSTARAVGEDTEVAISCQPADVLDCPATATFASGQTTTTITVEGLVASNETVTLTATLNDSEATAGFRVYDDDSVRHIVATEPTALTLYPETVTPVTVYLDIPAASTGTTVLLDSADGVVSVADELVVLAGETSGTFEVTTSTTLGTDTVQLYSGDDLIEIATEVVEKPIGEGLLFSQYIEGSSNNKILEIHNADANDIALDGCTVKIYANGNTSPSSTVALTTTATLASGEQWVLCHTQQAVLTSGECDQSASLSYNGNDALELTCGSELQDVFGQVGNNPGNNWGTTAVTVDATLTRSCDVTIGDRDGSDAFDPDATWTAAAKDDVTGIGSHCN